MTPLLLKLYKHIDNIHVKGTESHIFLFLGLSFNFILKKRKIVVIF